MAPSPSTLINEQKRKSNARHGPAKKLKGRQDGADDNEECGPWMSVLPEHLQHPITAKELMELLHYAALPGTNSVKQPSWCRVHGQQSVEGVNVVVVEGVTQRDFYKHYMTFRRLRSNYTSRVTFMPSTSNLLSGIFSSDVATSGGSYVDRAEKDRSKLHKVLTTHPVVTKFGTRRRGLTAYLLPQQEMIRGRYPVKGMPGFEEFVCTDSDDVVTDASPLFGLDCEMCLTVRGYEVTRVSLVDCWGTCVLDQLVKPDNKILDYVTQFSGITAAMLQPVRTKLGDVQGELRRLLPRDAVLVGHSINSDLTALKLIHPHVIDTSLLYRREFGQRFKLKVLAETVLQRQIQTEERTGHDPAEDALAALELAQYFIRSGPLQVLEDHLEELWGLTLQEESTHLESEPSSRFAEVLQRLGRSVCYVGKRCDVALHLANQQWLHSDKEVVASFRRLDKVPFFSVLHLSSLSKRSRDLPPDLHHKVSAHLRDMCLLFAGPLPVGFSEREVRRLFRCCGHVLSVKMLNTTHRVHALVEFKLLEGAVLALQTLNGIQVQGHTMKVQRPVNESTLDFDVILNALMSDVLNTRRLYVVKLKPLLARSVSAKRNGHTKDAERAEVNSCASTSLPANTFELSEETLAQRFGRFGAVEGIFAKAKPGRRARHACIQFASPEGKHAALSSSEELWRENFLVCPALTPPHMTSWVADDDNEHNTKGKDPLHSHQGADCSVRES
ncbi:RNA exonuclease 5-like isoform X2 [Dunckerocampus dactyliophorus]|uniref:RNA exonuclease 5-like isoform X2 n=1 Tax=Dunckerocampus dactyliophorus TaxID=161453 RepID=UPI0024065110|nr:RNA exonuclease 5-like isoform X2 [Dunckerocampus dactyliophorus]